MAETFEGKISTTLKEIRNTLRDDSIFNEAIAEGFDKMTYPAAQIIPVNSIYQNDLEYSDSFQIRFVFEKGPKHIDLIEATEKVETVTDQLLTDLESNTEAKEFKPTEFNYLVAENNGTRLNIIEVTWSTSKLIDFTA